MQKFSFWAIIGAGLVLPLALAATPLPVHAEEPPEVLYQVDNTQNRDQLLREEARRVDGVIKNYFNRMQVADKLDNDIRYLLTKSHNLQGQELSNYLEKYVMPKNEQLLQCASQVTTSSTALRELNQMFIDYATARAKVLEGLIGLGRIKIPARYYQEFSASSFAGFNYSSSSSSYEEAHVPPSVIKRMSVLRGLLNDLYTARSLYLNRKAYIIRNKADLIPEEK